MDANIHGNDAGAGFERDWVQMVELNTLICPAGTEQAVAEAIEGFRKKEISVFIGDYIGVDPFDPTDIYDLSQGFEENAETSAPMFHYVLRAVIMVE